MNSFTADDIRAIIRSIRDSMHDERAHLIDLDSAIGDGDLGITMCRGFDEAVNAIESSGETDPGKLLMLAGMTIAKTAPSTMGTLVATGFMKGGKAVSGKAELGLSEIAVFFDEFVDGIMARGGAKPGEKTIVDALLPAVEALRKAERENIALTSALETACSAASGGAVSTKQMIAVHGRPAYYGDKSIGREDPGAHVGLMIMRVFANSPGQ